MSYVYNADVFATSPTQTIKMPPRYELLVSYELFKFRVILTPDTISVGGKFKNCVQLTIASSEIAWVKSSDEGDCEINNKSITGDNTLIMIRIAYWFLQNGYKDIIYPMLSQLYLTDSSKFSCKLSDGSVRSMSMMHRDALVHGQTFYQRKLGAIPAYPQGEANLHKFQENRKKTKPVSFHFNNKDLEEMLRPIYNDTITWEDFMKRLVTIYGSRGICEIMYPWYLQAISIISEGSEIPTRWVVHDLTPKIKPVVEGPYVGSAGGGYIDVSPNFHEGWDLWELSYKHIKPRKLRMRKTRKHRSRSKTPYTLSCSS